MKRRKKKQDTDSRKLLDYKCRTCANCLFDEQWGEFKCKAHEIRLYNVTKIYQCDEYEKK